MPPNLRLECSGCIVYCDLAPGTLQLREAELRAMAPHHRPRWIPSSMSLWSRFAGLCLGGLSVRYRRATVEPPRQVSTMLSAAEAGAALTEGVEHLRGQRYELAASRLELAISTAYDSAEAHYYLGLAYSRLGRMEDAGDELAMAVHFSPEMSRAHFELARLQLKQGKRRQALESATRAVETGASPEMLSFAGALRLEMGDIKGAVSSFESAIEADPNCASAYTNLGYVLLSDCGDYKAGARHIEHALALNPEEKNILGTTQCSLPIGGSITHLCFP